ncbi:hypothetical protein Sjap_020923 [Stephania japonica]|uniref:C2 domain-containing protein n=1 Tax=Stephania japonica TaxID=461633 RepID=A0AAP0F2H9_9MAGN
MTSLPPPTYDLEVTICSATNLKNINWRHGPLKPYAVLWADPNSNFKSSTRVDEDGDTCPVWDETIVLPIRAPIDDSILRIDIVHAYAPDDVKPLIGSGSVPLREIVEEFGVGSVAGRTLQLTRPSGRPQGTLEVKIVVRDRRLGWAAPPPPPAAYGVAPPPTPVGYGGYPAPPPPPPMYYAAEPVGYPAAAPSSGYPVAVEERKKGKGMGAGAGLALGAVAGVLGGIALTEGVEHLEEKIEDDVAEKVEEDLAYDDGGFGGDDFY